MCNAPSTLRMGGALDWNPRSSILSIGGDLQPRSRWSRSVLGRARPDSPQSDEAHDGPHSFQEDEAILPLQNGDDGKSASADEVQDLIGQAHRSETPDLTRGKRYENQ